MRAPGPRPWLILALVAQACGGPRAVVRDPPPAAPAFATATPGEALSIKVPREVCGVPTHAGTLELECKKVTELPPLAGLTELQYLHLKDAALNDLAVLSGHKSLRALRIDQGEIRDTAGLERVASLRQLSWWGPLPRGTFSGPLPALRTLSLKAAGLLSLEPVAKLSTLEALSIFWNGKPLDLAPLAKLRGLRRLRLDRTDASGHAVLASLSDLEELTLTASGDESFPSFEHSPKLGKVEVYLVRADLESVGRMTALRSLRLINLSDKKTLEVTPLLRLPRLETLAVEQASVDLAAVSRLTELRELLLPGTRLSKVAKLGSLSKLARLEIWRPTPADLKALRSLPALRDLRMESARIPDFTPLAVLPELRALRVGRSYIGDGHEGFRSLKGIEQLKHLESLAMGHDPQTDDPISLAPLRAAKRLKHLVLSEGDWADYEALAGLPLETLSVSGDPEFDPSALSAQHLRVLSLEYISEPLLRNLSHLNQLVELSVAADELGELEFLEQMSRLRKLFLGGSVRSLARLAALRELEELTLSSIWKHDLAPLAQLPRLRKLHLMGVSVTPESLRAFRVARPNCELIAGDPHG